MTKIARCHKSGVLAYIAVLGCVWSLAACGQEAPHGGKAKFHRYSDLRSGAVKTEKGWKVDDFAIFLFNTGSEPISVTWKLISNDSKFVFQDKKVGTWSKSYTVKPMSGVSENVYGYVDLPNFPVLKGTYFTGSMEVSGSAPFYFFLLPQIKPVEAADGVAAYYQAWRAWSSPVPATWDEDLKAFVIPYINYWHNWIRCWEKGWHTRLVIANGRGQPVKYVIRHVPLYFKTVELDGSGELAASGKKSEYGEQTVEKSLAANEKLETYLEDIYGWATKPRSEMEGCLLVSPVPAAAAQQTTVTCDVLPNDK